MGRMTIAALLLTAFLNAHAAATEPDKWADLEVATVNGDALTIKDLRSQFKSRHGGHTKFLGGEEELRTFLRIAIEDRLLLQEAYEIGLDADPAVKNDVIAFEDEKASDAFVKLEVEEKSKPTLEEIRYVWETYGTFLVRIREIGVRTRIEAEEIRNGLLHGGDAETLARSCSLLMTRQRGGLRISGWGNSDPKREALILSLDAGDVSPVLEIDGGFEVLVGEGRVDAVRPDFEVTKDAISAILEKRKKEERENAISNEVWSKYHARIVLDDVSLPSFQKLLDSTPDAVIATWDSGKLTAREAASRNELSALVPLSAAEATQKLDTRIRATVNGALFAREARERHLNDLPEIADAVTDFREKLMLDALYGEHILKDFALADGDVQKYFESHANEFFEPEKRQVAQILVGSENDAKAVVAELNKGTSFADVAKARSRDITTASSGGDLGWITADHVPPTFADVFKLAAGKFTQPVRSKAGWHVIKVVAVQPKRQLSFAEAQERVTKAVSEEKKRGLRDAWLEKLRAAATIAIHDDAIRTFVAANPLDPRKPAPSMQHAMDGMPPAMQH